MDALEQGFQLDGLRVNPQTGEVAGPGGRERLDRKVMGVLLYMARHAGHVVTREELHAALWPGAVVTDDAATRCFYELRRHLRLAGGDDRYRELIQTLPKRGYRLNATVRPDVPSATPAASPDPGPDPAAERVPRRRALAVAAVALGLVAIAASAYFYGWLPAPAPEPEAPATTHSIAVLPFMDMSESKDQRYLSDGVTEEILNHLAQASNLRVISRTSTFALRDSNLDIPEIGKRLGVDYVLEGSVRRSGDRLRLTAQLINVASNSHAWSQTYDRTLDDLFAVQDEIASSVARELQVELSGDARPVTDPDSLAAYELYLQGQFHYHRRSEGDVQLAIDYYEKAVESDPRFARAWAALAGAYSLANGDLYGNMNDELRQKQGRAAFRAAELAPRLAVAQSRLAQYYYRVLEIEKGDEHMRLAASLNPDDPLVLGFAASDAAWNGDLQAATGLWRKAVTQDPLSPTVRANLAFFLLADGQLEEALAEYRRALELNPASVDMRGEVARILVLLGRYDEAMPVIERIPEGHWHDFSQALLHRVPERRAEADAALERLAAGAVDSSDHVHLAEAYAYRGMDDDAMATLIAVRLRLDRERKQRPANWWAFQDELRLAPLLKPLHDDPRWAGLTALPDDR